MMLMRIGGGPREHDYTKNSWGRALHGPKMVDVVEPAQSLWQKWFGPKVTSRILQAQGHGSIREGDTILLRMESGKVGRFVVRDVSYSSNPEDMFDLKRADFVDYVATDTPNASGLSHTGVDRDEWRCVDCKTVVQAASEPKRCGCCPGRTFAHIIPAPPRKDIAE